MNRLFILIAFLSLCGGHVAVAQGIDSFKRNLQAPDSALSTQVIVNEHGDATVAVRSTQVHPTGEKVRGYRVRIFFDNSQNARSLAQDVKKRFEEAFPDIPAYMVYENPNFKVSVGNCLTKEEAIILEAKVKPAFETAFLIVEDIPMSYFGE